jgi:hypothetical protein
MGPTTLVGMAVLILFVPIVQFIMSRMLVIRRQRVDMTDQRVNIVNSMLQGVRTSTGVRSVFLSPSAHM